MVLFQKQSKIQSLNIKDHIATFNSYLKKANVPSPFLALVLTKSSRAGW